MTYELCIVCVRALARVQSTVKRCLLFTECASGGHFDNDEYIESYGKTYDGYIYIYIYRRARCTTRRCGARSGSPQLKPIGTIVFTPIVAIFQIFVVLLQVFHLILTPL